MHAHLGQDEGFTVLEGVMGYQVAGQEARYATAGESVVFQAGEPHRFWNAGEAELRCSGYIEPAGNAEYLLRAVFASQLANGGKRPSLFDVAFLMRRYRSEFVMTAVPRPLQAALFPPLVLLGRLLGRYRKYADAPPPA